MARYKKCPWCKGKHRKQGAYNKCKRKYAPLEKWPK